MVMDGGCRGADSRFHVAAPKVVRSQRVADPAPHRKDSSAPLGARPFSRQSIRVRPNGWSLACRIASLVPSAVLGPFGGTGQATFRLRRRRGTNILILCRGDAVASFGSTEWV